MPTDAEYLESLGRAIYRWAQVEWAIVYVAKELHSEGLTVHRSANMTASHIARRLRGALADTKVSDDAFTDAKSIADQYESLLQRRSDIVHAHPANISGLHRLHSVQADGTYRSIEPDDLAAFSADCVRLSNRASALLWTLRRGETR